MMIRKNHKTKGKLCIPSTLSLGLLLSISCKGSIYWQVIMKAVFLIMIPFLDHLGHSSWWSFKFFKGGPNIN